MTSASSVSFLLGVGSCLVTRADMWQLVGELSFITKELFIKQTGVQPEDFVAICTVKPNADAWNIGYDNPMSIDHVSNTVAVMSSGFATVDQPGVQKSGGIFINLDTCETAYWYLPRQERISVSSLTFLSGS